MQIQVLCINDYLKFLLLGVKEGYGDDGWMKRMH